MRNNTDEVINLDHINEKEYNLIIIILKRNMQDGDPPRMDLNFIQHGTVRYRTVREGLAANTNLMARCQIPHVNMFNPVPYCTVAYGTVALNLSTR